MENIREKLDDLAIRNLELIEERVRANIKLEELLKNGRIELANAKLLRGKEHVGLLQVPVHKKEIFSLFQLQTTSSEESSSGNAEFDINFKPQDVDKNTQNPLKWFGILVPESLKTSQKYFQEATFQAVKIANIQAEQLSLMNEFKILGSMKDSV